jgi:hypothetical protein
MADLSKLQREIAAIGRMIETAIRIGPCLQGHMRGRQAMQEEVSERVFTNAYAVPISCRRCLLGTRDDD